MTLQRTTSRQHTSKGFSLLELLAVMAIIAIIVAIIVIVHKGAIGKSKKLACQNHIKNLYQGLTFYLDDQTSSFESSFPAQFDDDFLQTYVGSNQIAIRCPLVPETELGYTPNPNLATVGKLKSGTNFGEIFGTNVAIYENVSGSSLIDPRHDNMAFGISVTGEILTNVQNTDIAFKTS